MCACRCGPFAELTDPISVCFEFKELFEEPPVVLLGSGFSGVVVSND